MQLHKHHLLTSTTKEIIYYIKMYTYIQLQDTSIYYIAVKVKIQSILALQTAIDTTVRGVIHTHVHIVLDVIATQSVSTGLEATLACVPKEIIRE